jgi:hypothetical protein
LRSATPVLAAAVFAFSLVAWSGYGVEGTLVRDDAIYVYGGQQLAEGVPPYLSIFQIKGPLTTFLAGLGVAAGRSWGVDDLLAVRIGFALISALAAAALFGMTADLLRSPRAGLLAALCFVAFWGFGKHAFSGPRGKTPAVLAQIAALWLTSRRAWFASGLCGSLAFLAWQPMAIYAVGPFVVAVGSARSLREALRAGALVALGAALPVAATVAYFAAVGGLAELAEGVALFNLTYLDRPAIAISTRLWAPVLSVIRGYPQTALPIAIGLGAILFAYLRPVAVAGTGGLRAWLGSPFAPLLVTFPAPVLWSLLDYQDYPDFYPFLAYAAFGFAWACEGALSSIAARWRALASHALTATLVLALTAGSIALYRSTSERGLVSQRRAAEEVTRILGPQARVASIGVPQVLVLLRARNPSRYVMLDDGTERLIEDTHPGGIQGWLAHMERARPDVVTVAGLGLRRRNEVLRWLQTHYTYHRVGPWSFFIRRPS